MNAMEVRLEEIRQLLSHLHGEVTALESNYQSVLKVLRKFEQAADRDDLTGLLRRAAFFENWKKLLLECSDLNQSCGVMIIDIDHFKYINDTHGHPTGDEVIKAVANLLNQYESENCIVARIGGEEFAIALRGTPAELIGMAEFIRRGAEKLHGPTLTESGEPSRTIQWKCTLSIGVASLPVPVTIPVPGMEPEAAMKEAMTAADAALYKAKRKGRNQVCAA